MNIVELIDFIKPKSKIWLIAYIATILMPIAIIFNRTAMEVATVTIGTLFLVESFRTKEWKWLGDPIIVLGFISWVWLLFISILPQAPPQSLGIALAWIRYLLLYAGLKNWVLTEREHMVFLGKTLLLIFILVLFDTLWQYIFGVSLTGHLKESNGRLTGPLDNVKVGIFLAKILFPTIAIFWISTTEKTKSRSLIYGFAIILVTIATIMLSGERTAFFSTLIALSFASVFLILFDKSFYKPLAILLLLVTAQSAVLLKTQHSIQNRTQKFHEAITNYSASEYGQLQKAGIIIGMDNFWTGAGLKGFRDICSKMFADGTITTQNLHPHNIYIEWFAETGIIGVLLFVAIVFCLFYKVIKELISGSNSNRIVQACTLATLVVNFFPFMPTQSIFSNWPAILLWYSVSIAVASTNVLTINKNNQPLILKI